MKLKTSIFTLVLPLFAFMASANAAVESVQGTIQAITKEPAPVAGSQAVWQAKSRGAHQTEWAVIRSLPAGKGGTRMLTNKVTEIASGLNVRDANGNYHSASAAFALTERGGEATNAAHRVLVRPLITEALQIEKDGLTLTCRPVCISFYDPVDGRSYLLGEITNNAVGYLVSPQTVIFSNCFSGLRASIRYRNSKASIQQDLILEERPGISPEALGFSPYTRLELWSAWGTNAPAPDQTFDYLHVERNPAVRQAMLEPDVIDTTLSFSGKLRMGSGKAFTIGGQTNAPHRRRAEIPVSKTWQVISGESVLIEAIDYNRALPLMQNLPVSTNTTILTNAAVRSPSPLNGERAGLRGENVGPIAKTLVPNQSLVTSSATRSVRILPPVRSAPPVRSKIQNVMVTADARSSTPSPASGFLIDFDLTDGESLTNFVFQRQEYLCSGIVYFRGETVISGGTIVKFTPWDPDDEEHYPYALILIWDAVKCLTSMYSPAVFTAVGDNTVGSILDESGVPQYYAEALAVSNSTNELQYLRISYATQAALHTLGTHLKHSQILNCGIGIMTEGHTMRLENVIMANISDTAIYSHECLGSGTHMTIDGCYMLTRDYDDAPSTSFVLTNSILRDIDENGDFLTAYDHTEFVYSDGGPYFQSVGNGLYYLTNSSSFRNAGTTNISASLAVEMQSLTHDPPVVFAKKIFGNTNLVLSPQAQRGGSPPSLGYAYPPMDFVFGRVYSTNSTILLTNGVVIGTYCPIDGDGAIVLDDHATFVSSGSADMMNRIVRYNTVQEQSTTNWGLFVGPSVQTTYNGHAPQEVRFRFTDWSMLAHDADHVFGYPSGADFPVGFRDCQFHGGSFTTWEPIFNVTNCLFDQVAVDVEDWSGTINPTFRICTFYGGSLNLSQTYGGTWTFLDNIFDKTTIACGGSISNDYNGYVTNASRIGTGAHDVVLSTTNVGWQSSWLGNFYLPTNSAFIDKASLTNSALIAMYHYTTLTNQTKELTNHLDCGFHYVAVSNGVPLDADGDLLADYLEDFNGNGVVDAGETDWNNPDTDGDGVSDYLELLQGRNPLVSGSVADTNNLINLRVYTPLK